MTRNVNKLLPSDVVDNNSKEIINQITKTNDTDELKQLTAMFNLNMAKKNMMRLLKLSGLLDVLSETAIERVNNHPDEITNKELIDYLNVIQTLIDKSTKNVDEATTNVPVIQINTQNNIIANDTILDTLKTKESRDRVLAAVAEVKKMIALQQGEIIEDDNNRI